MNPNKRVANAADAVRSLVDAAFAARFHDLEIMLRSASMAVALAEERREELEPDLVATAWIEYGNALRLSGRYQEAEKALDRAAKESISDPSTQAHLLEVTASLHRLTQRFDSAAGLLKSAIAAQGAVQDRNGAARHYNQLGIVLLDDGNPSQALYALQTALDLLEGDSPVDVLVATGHNLVETLIAANRLSAAAVALVVLEPYYSRLTSRRVSAKSEWMRARLFRKQHHLEAASRAYQRAFDLLSTEPRSPELAELAQEMADLLPIADPRS